MKILYLSCHAILEYDEVRLLSELGHDVFSVGDYSNPAGSNLFRPAIPNLKAYPEFYDMSMEMRWSANDEIREIVPDALIEWCDIIIYMHMPCQLARNWTRIRHKRVIFRAIGQNTEAEENVLRPLRADGLQIVRYSPMERNIPGYCGEDYLIRFYKDPDEYKGWNGEQEQAINITNRLTARAQDCAYNEIRYLTWNLPHKIYGAHNEDLGEQWGGLMTPDEHTQVLQNNRCFIYGGTWPASYTLSFMEALMTGIPLVAVGPRLANSRANYNYYEIPYLLTNNENGFCSDDLIYLRDITQKLLINHEFAQQISTEGRKLAIKLFGKEKIAQQWKELLS